MKIISYIEAITSSIKFGVLLLLLLSIKFTIHLGMGWEFGDKPKTDHSESEIENL